MHGSRDDNLEVRCYRHALAETIEHQSRLWYDIVDCILDDRPAAPSFYDGLTVQQVMEAAIQSHERGRWITL